MNTLDPSIADRASYTRTRITADAGDNWPQDPTVITHVIDGVLADRVRTRLDEDGDVRLTETTIHGGYSVYTQENNTEFTVACGTREVTFYPRGGQVDWLDDVGAVWADSVFARFDAWLNAASRPVELFAEWFDFHEEAGQVLEYRSKPGTTLTRAAKEHRYFCDHLTLRGVGDHGTGRMWELDLIAEDGKILDRINVGYFVGTALTPDVARGVLYDITDELMLGKEN